MHVLSTYLAQNTDNDSTESIILTGDFNFPKKIFKWLCTVEGLIPSCTGNTTEKKAFRKLWKVVVEYELSQLVDRETRGEEIPDLLSTNTPDKFGNCKVTESFSVH